MVEKSVGPPAPHDFFATRNVAAPILGAFGAEDRALAGRNPMALVASNDAVLHHNAAVLHHNAARLYGIPSMR